jgi:CubicO group peptidase (beta-lactamase class C family)
MKRNPRADELEAGVLPIVRVEGEDASRPLADRMAFHHVPGFAVAVIADDQIAWTEGFGTQEAGKDDPVTADTIFAGASISKPVTAVVALRLVEQGLLDLDRPANDFLTAWKIPDNEFTAEKAVTLRHLLSHRAGTTVHGFGGIPDKPTVLDTLHGRPPARTAPVCVDKVPGGVPRYSGGGITVVQLMLEEASGKGFAQLAKELVFDPLGMTRSSFVHPLPNALMAETSRGHNEDGSVVDGGYSWCPQLAAGGIFTTAPDYARFIIACRAAFIGKPGAILGPDLARQMMDRDGAPDQGLGWRLLGEGATQRFEHGGSCQGYQCETMCYLHRGDGVVVLTNGVGGLNFYWEVINTVAEMHAWPGYLPPKKQPRDLTAEQRALLSGRFRIVSGVDAPFINVWEEAGVLYSEIVGMRGGKRRVRMDQFGRLFNERGPYDTAIDYDSGGRAMGLRVYESSGTEIMRAVRDDPA